MPDHPMTFPTPEEQPTMTVWPEAGHWLGISRPLAFAAAASGEIPVIRVGRRILVPTAALRRMLQLDDKQADGTAGAS